MGPGRRLFLAMVWTGKHLFLNYNHEKGSDEYLLKVTEVRYLINKKIILSNSHQIHCFFLILKLDDSKF